MTTLLRIEVVAGELLANLLSTLVRKAPQPVSPATAAPVPQATVEADAAAPSRDEVKAALVNLQREHGTAGVAELLQQFGAKKLSDLPDNRMPEVFAEIQGRLAS